MFRNHLCMYTENINLCKFMQYFSSTLFFSLAHSPSILFFPPPPLIFPSFFLSFSIPPFPLSLHPSYPFILVQSFIYSFLPSSLCLFLFISHLLFPDFFLPYIPSFLLHLLFPSSLHLSLYLFIRPSFLFFLSLFVP